MKIQVNKLAVFDLDDTIYDGNSHFMLLNMYYNTSFFTSIPIRILGRFFPKLRMLICNKFYSYVPLNVRKTYELPYRDDVMNLFHQKQNEGWMIVIASNAPDDLLQNAANHLNVRAFRADFSQKATVISENFNYRKLFVCTDNKTDIDLLQLADEAVITCKEKDIPYFENKLKHENISFMNGR